MRELVSKYIEADSDGNPISYVEISGKSTETKPTEGIAFGSFFHEVDTGDVYSFDEEDAAWEKQFSFKG